MATVSFDTALRPLKLASQVFELRMDGIMALPTSLLGAKRERIRAKEIKKLGLSSHNEAERTAFAYIYYRR